MLIVLDNAANSDQMLPLLPEASGCLVLITSRRKLTGVTDAYPLSLDVLGWDDAEQLLIKLLGAQRARPQRGPADFSCVWPVVTGDQAYCRAATFADTVRTAMCQLDC